MKLCVGAGTTAELKWKKICFVLDLLCLVGSNFCLWAFYPGFGIAVVCITSSLAGFFEALAKYQRRTFSVPTHYNPRSLNEYAL